MSAQEYKGHHEATQPYAKGWLAPMYVAFAINCVTLVLLNAKGYPGWGWAFVAFNGLLVVAIAYVHIARDMQK